MNEQYDPIAIAQFIPLMGGVTFVELPEIAGTLLVNIPFVLMNPMKPGRPPGGQMWPRP